MPSWIRSRTSAAALLVSLVCAAAPLRAFAVDGGTAPTPPAQQAQQQQAAPPGQTGQKPQAQEPPTVPEPPPPPAEPTPEQIARAELEVAQRQYDLGRFDQAIEHYGRAYEAMPLPALLFNIAQAHRQLRHYREAAFFYRRFLDLSQNQSNTSLAKDLLAEMEAQQRTLDQEERSARAAERALKDPPAAGTAEGPVYKRWWFWAATGGAVATVATLVTVAAVNGAQPSLGTVNGR